MTQQDAQDLVQLTDTEVDNAMCQGAELAEVEGIIADNLGLEPDYLL